MTSAKSEDVKNYVSAFLMPVLVSVMLTLLGVIGAQVRADIEALSVKMERRTIEEATLRSEINHLKEEVIDLKAMVRKLEER